MQSKQAHEPQSPQSCNDAQDLLLPQEYAHKVAHAQITLEETCTALHQKTILSDTISAQDHRELHTACFCLNSLRIRVEALANVAEQSVRSRQMQNRKQLRSPENLHANNNSSLTSGTPHRFSTSKSPGQP